MKFLINKKGDKKMTFDYSKELKIDLANLDELVIEQSVKFMEIAESHAKSVYERDEAKVFMDTVEAELDLMVRKSPQSYGLEKTTESAIRNIIICHKDFKSAQEKHMKANYNVKILESARDAWEQRKKAFEILTSLYVAGYWSKPKTKREDGSDVTAAQTEFLNRNKGD
jgi:hypothetical protein